MAKKEKEHISISASTLETLLFNACRYGVGRHSYAVTDAEDYWPVIKGNMNLLSENRIKFLARDIRANVSDCLHWTGNIHVENAYNSTIKKDAVTLLAEYLMEHPDTDIPNTYFDIDCVACTVSAKPWEKPADRVDTNGEKIWSPRACDFYHEFHDLNWWVKLAECIDNRYLVTGEYNGKSETIECIKCIDLVYDYDDEKHERCNPHFIYRYVRNDRWSVYIADEYITKIEKI